MRNELHHLADQQLIQLFKQGNDIAFTVLVHRYKANVYTSIIIMMKDAYISDDIFQETFIKVCRTIKSDKYNEQGKFLPWVIRIAHNLCIDHFRRVKQKVNITMQDGTDLMDFIAVDRTENAEQKMIRRQSEVSIKRLIDQLPEEQSEVLILRIFGDLSFKEIANITEVSINTALGRMRYALINMRKMIEERNLVLR